MTLETTRQPGLTPHSDVPRPPFGGKQRLLNVAPVRFAGAFTTHEFDVGELRVRPGDSVVAVTSKGPMIGRVAALPERKLVPSHEARRVLRVADDADSARWAELQEEGNRVLKAGVRALRRMRSPIKLVSVEIPLDSSRIIVFYSTEERTDVRPLVRALAKEVDGRIDLRQIGIREGAGAIGGIGPCGNELCCSSFLTDFSSISIRFAKDQGLSLNPQRIMGMCGRLKCCLVYEQAVYKEMKRYAPRRKSGVITPRGAGNVLEVDGLARKVKVRLHHAIESFHLRDVVVLDHTLSPQEIAEGGLSKEESVLEARRQRRGGTSDSRGGMSRQAASVLQEEYLWEDMAGAAEIREDVQAPDDASKKKRRRRRAKPSGSGRGGSKRGGQGGAQPQQAKGQGAQSGAPKKKRRRRRRGKSGGGNSGGGNSGGGNSGGGNSGGGNSGGGG